MSTPKKKGKPKQKRKKRFTLDDFAKLSDVEKLRIGTQYHQFLAYMREYDRTTKPVWREGGTGRIIPDDELDEWAARQMSKNAASPDHPLPTQETSQQPPASAPE